MERRTLSVSEAAQVLGISRAHAYDCVRTGELPSIALGRRVVVPRQAIEELLAHGSSRSSDRDPLLHTHVLVANSVCTDDGRWRTIDAVALYDHAKTGGYIYQAQLRHELTTRLGVAWSPIHDGLADIAGVDQELIDLFSKRREQIESTMAEWGMTSARAAQVLTLETRRAKAAESEPVSEQIDRWRAEASTIGVDSSDLQLVTGQHEVPSIDAAASTELFERLSSSAGLTADRSTFDHRDVLRAVIDQVPAALPVETVERLADEYLRRPEIVMIGWNERTGTTFSTTELVELEQSVVDLAEHGLTAGVGVAVETAVEGAVETRPSISDEQAAVVTEMCTSGRGVEVLVAAAGTGKTFSLDAAREAWQRSGYTVIGCALSASAAHELQGGSGIRSSTIAMLNLDIYQDRRRLDARTVLVIDEAGMVGTRTLAPLLQHAGAAGAKVVLVGDPKQLPEIQAGGVLASLANRHPVLTLTENRRQIDPTERTALGQLRSGDVDRAIGMLRDHGRVVTSTNAETVRDGMVEQWWQHRTSGDDALMMARRNADVDDLNRRARRHVLAAGELSGEPLVVHDRPFQIGDQVICTRNDYANGVRNGTTGTITHIDHQRTAVTLSTEEGVRRLDDEYLSAGSVRHGYAVTVHKAQGRTCEHGLLLASDDLHSEMGYVGLSRGRQSNRMYLVAEEPADELEHHGRPGDRADPLDLVADSLRRSDAKELAVDQRAAQAEIDDGADVGW